MLQHRFAVRLIVLIILLTFLVTWSVSAVARDITSPTTGALMTR